MRYYSTVLLLLPAAWPGVRTPSNWGLDRRQEEEEEEKWRRCSSRCGRWVGRQAGRPGRTRCSQHQTSTQHSEGLPGFRLYFVSIHCAVLQQETQAGRIVGTATLPSSVIAVSCTRIRVLAKLLFCQCFHCLCSKHLLLHNALY